jgi:hypothetical protein
MDVRGGADGGVRVATEQFVASGERRGWDFGLRVIVNS